MGQGAQYCITDASLSNLVPLPDVQTKVAKEVSLQKHRAEKQARTQVEQFLKQQSQGQGTEKNKKVKASTSSKGSAVEPCRCLVCGRPA